MKTSQADNLSLMLKGMLPKTKGAAAVKLAMNFKRINDELSGYRSEKTVIFKKYGEEKGDNLVVSKDSENYPLFLEEINEIDNIEINPDFQIIVPEELEKTDLSAQDILILMDVGMVKEKKDDHSGV